MKHWYSITSAEVFGFARAPSMAFGSEFAGGRKVPGLVLF